MSYPKQVQTWAAEIREAGFTPEVVVKRKHYQIKVDGELVFTLHHGSKQNDATNHLRRSTLRRLKERKG